MSADDRIEALIEASSLGTPAAKQARESVSIERAQRIVDAVNSSDNAPRMAYSLVRSPRITLVMLTSMVEALREEGVKPAAELSFYWKPGQPETEWLLCAPVADDETQPDIDAGWCRLA